jgi:hypothetical protein
MENMDRWDIVLLVVAGYLAVAALSRLMARHRDRRIGQLREQMEQEQRHNKKNKPQPQQRAA